MCVLQHSQQPTHHNTELNKELAGDLLELVRISPAGDISHRIPALRKDRTHIQRDHLESQPLHIQLQHLNAQTPRAKKLGSFLIPGDIS